MGYEAELAREADLAEGGQGSATRGASAEGNAPGRRGEGQGNRQVGPRLIDAHPARDGDEHVARPERDAAVPGEDGQDDRETIAVDAVADPSRLLELRG